MTITLTENANDRLQARHIPFEFPDDIDPHWIPNDPEMSAMINGASLTMPYLEPFLIKSIQESLSNISDAQLRKDIIGFSKQEGQHYKTHRSFNDLLIKKRYSKLVDIENDMQESYAKLSEKSLQTRMAYTAGFEAMTVGITQWFIGDRVKLFAGADTRVTSFVLWHAVEETEHKHVAYDAYIALYGRSIKSYFIRALGVFHGSFDVMRFSRKGYKSILKKDGLWNNVNSRFKLASKLFRFMLNVAPFLFRAALPGHNPRTQKDLDWVIDWLHGYQNQPANAIPLVDTNHPLMPVPFNVTK